jgi:hypothetical protein
MTQTTTDARAPAKSARHCIEWTLFLSIDGENDEALWQQFGDSRFWCAKFVTNALAWELGAH